MRRIVLLAAGVALLGSGCARLDLQGQTSPCDRVIEEYDAQEVLLDAANSRMSALGSRPTDYQEAMEWDAAAATALDNYISKKRVQARIVVNNRDCFTETDLASAQEFLDDPVAAIRNSYQH